MLLFYHQGVTKPVCADAAFTNSIQKNTSTKYWSHPFFPVASPLPLLKSLTIQAACRAARGYVELPEVSLPSSP